MDRLAAGEVDELGLAVGGDVDGLGDEAFEVHLDAAFGGVPAGAVDEGVEVEVGAEFAVEMGEDVLVEGRGDAGGVVVGGEEGFDGFVGAGGEVRAEEEGVARGEVGAETAEDGGGLGGREVADAGADVKGEDAAAVGALEGVGLGDVVGDLGMDEDAGDGGGEVGGGFGECGGADVDGLVEDLGLEAGGGLEEEAGLGGGAGAKFGDGDGGDEFEEDFVGVGGEEGALGAGEVILGECGDLLEELGATLVVEEPGREGLLGGGEAGEGFVEDGLGGRDGGRGGQGRPRWWVVGWVRGLWRDTRASATATTNTGVLPLTGSG